MPRVPGALTFAFLVLVGLAARPGEGRAAVLYTTDLEAAGLGQGGAYIAAPTTGGAVWYNPAGFAAQRGLRLELEGGVILSPLTYAPAPDPGGREPTVENDDMVQPAGLVGLSYDFGTRDFTAGLFAYVPSSSTYHYDPAGPQRFQGVGGHYVLGFFHAALAYRLWDTLSLGVSFGPTYFHALQYNDVTAAPGGADPRDENWCVAVATEVTSPLFFSTNLGISYAPTWRWAFGASLMPPFDVDASGTIALTPSAVVASLAQIDGDAVKVHLQFPLVARAGIRFFARPNLAFELAGVFEGWSRFQSIDLQPDVTVTAPALGIDMMKVPPISLAKGYRDVLSVRLGGEYEAREWLTVRAGAYFESSGSATSRFDITAPEADKVGLTLGATLRLAPALYLDAALAHTFFPDVAVSDSVLQIRNVLRPDNTAIVGNGSYEMSLSFVHVGLRFQR